MQEKLYEVFETREKLPFSLFSFDIKLMVSRTYTHTPLTLYNLEKIKLKRNVPWFHLYVLLLGIQKTMYLITVVIQ